MQPQTDSDGAVLADILKLHHSFILRGYAMFRFLRRELVDRHGFRWANPGGAARNGYGSSFESPDEWVQSYLGVGFVPKDAPMNSSFQTIMPVAGLRTILFQLRWLERSPEQPVVWIVKATLRPVGDEPVPLEPYLPVLFSKLARNHAVDDADSSAIQTISFAPKKYQSVECSGTYREASAASLTNESEISKVLIAETLVAWRASDAD